MQTMLDLFKAAGYENYEEMEICKPYSPKKTIEVLSYNLTTKETEWKKVKNLFYKGIAETQDSYNVSTEAGSFLCTGNHLMYVVGQNYLPVKILNEFITLSDTKTSIKARVTKTFSPFPILDVEVEDNANYFSNGMLSHNSFGGTAKLFSEGLRKLNPYLSRFGTSLILLNQVRDQIGGFAMPGMKPESTPGGRAVKFYASWRGRVSKMEDIADKKEVIGNTIKIRNAKSKVGFPKRIAQLELYYGNGFNPDQEYVDFIIKLGLVKQGGAWLSNEEWGMKVQGRDKLLDWLKANPDKFEECKAAVTASFTSSTVLDTLGSDEEVLDDDDDGGNED